MTDFVFTFLLLVLFACTILVCIITYHQISFTNIKTHAHARRMVVEVNEESEDSNEETTPTATSTTTTATMTTTNRTTTMDPLLNVQNLTSNATLESTTIPTTTKKIEMKVQPLGLLDLIMPTARVKRFKEVFDTFRRLLSHTFR